MRENMWALSFWGWLTLPNMINSSSNDIPVIYLQHLWAPCAWLDTCFRNTLQYQRGSNGMKRGFDSELAHREFNPVSTISVASSKCLNLSSP
jgi:hypothetical protein